MKELETIEICELGQIKVNARLNNNIIRVANECLYIARLLKVSIQLYWNGKYIDIYTNDTLQTIIDKSLKN